MIEICSNCGNHAWDKEIIMIQRRKPRPFARSPRDECADYKQRNHHSNRVFFWNCWFFLA